MSLKRGWCPTLDRPMLSGDGLLVRVQPRRARLTPHQAHALADAADAYGNGAIELTQRGNLQLRGLREESVTPFAAAMQMVSLPSPGPLLAPPLLGDDPAIDCRTEAIVLALEQAFARDPRLAGLPAKFAVAVDGGGVLSGRPVAADLVVGADGRVGQASHNETAVPVGALPYQVPNQVRAAGPLHMAFGLAPPFAQLDAAMLHHLADLAARHGTDIRVSPWRALLLGRVPLGTDIPHQAGPGWITDPADPRLLVTACIGSAGCLRGTVPTRADAARLRPSLPVHVSGCSKGCAHPGPAALTLVGQDGLYNVVRHGRAADPPVATGLSFEAAIR